MNFDDIFKTDKITCLSCGEKKVGGLWADTLITVKTGYKKVCQFKYGTLYSCPSCNSGWYLDEKETSLSSVLYANRIQEWKSVIDMIPESIIKGLQSIKATPPDFYGNGKDYIDFPCKAILKDGTILDPALVRLQKEPPFISNYKYRNNYKDYTIIDKLSKVEVSDFALPEDLRAETCMAREVRMNFSPTRAKAPNGAHYILNGTPDFFFHDNIKGSQLKVVPRNEWKNEEDMIYYENKFKMYFIIGLWDDELLKARIRLW